MSASSRAEGRAPGPHRPAEILSALKSLGFRVAVCVPDSWLGGIAERIEAEPGMTLVREQKPSTHGQRYFVAGSMRVRVNIQSRVPGLAFSVRMRSGRRGSDVD